MKIRIKKGIALFLTMCIIISVMMVEPNSVHARTDKIDIQTSYVLKGDTVVETVEFIDVDGEKATMVLMVASNGSATLVTTKNNESIIKKINGYDYKSFYNQVFPSDLSQEDIHGVVIRGSDVTGSQYKHVYISSTGGEFDANATQTAAGIASIILGIIPCPAAHAAGIAITILGLAQDRSATKFVLTDYVYEVIRTYDNSYYTHCYHTYVRAYDSAGHFVKSFYEYRQSIGG